MNDVSVVIPTYKRPEPLARAITSALSSKRVLEVVVVDDDALGSAAPVCESFDSPRLRYYNMPKPSQGHPSLVRNYGFSLTRGRYVHFLDDDDFLWAGALDVLAKALDESEVGVAFGVVVPFSDPPHADAVVRDEAKYFENGAKRARVAKALGSDVVAVANMLFAPTPFVCSAAMTRASTFMGFDPDCDIVEDVDFYLRSIRAYGHVFVDEPVIGYRVGEVSLMHSANADTKTEAAYKVMIDKYRATYGLLETVLLKVLAKTIRMVVR